MSKENMEQFLKELTSLCFQYELWIEGKNLHIQNSDGVIVGTKLEYDHDTTRLYADYVESMKGQ